MKIDKPRSTALDDLKRLKTKMTSEEKSPRKCDHDEFHYCKNCEPKFFSSGLHDEIVAKLARDDCLDFSFNSPLKPPSLIHPQKLRLRPQSLIKWLRRVERIEFEDDPEHKWLLSTVWNRNCLNHGSFKLQCGTKSQKGGLSYRLSFDNDYESDCLEYVSENSGLDRDALDDLDAYVTGLECANCVHQRILQMLAEKGHKISEATFDFLNDKECRWDPMHPTAVLGSPFSAHGQGTGGPVRIDMIVINMEERDSRVFTNQAPLEIILARFEEQMHARAVKVAISFRSKLREGAIIDEAEEVRCDRWIAEQNKFLNRDRRMDNGGI